MKIFSIQQAKSRLSRLIERARIGGEMLARGKDRVVRLVSIGGRRGPRKLGMLKGKLVVGSEFFEPLPAEELASWECRSSQHKSNLSS